MKILWMFLPKRDIIQLRIQIFKQQTEWKKQPEDPFLYKKAAVQSVQNTKRNGKQQKKNGHDQEGGKLFDPETAQKKKARQNRTKAEKY